MFRIKRLTIEQIIVVLFAILPVIDSINGIFIAKGLPSIGTLYKLFTLALLFIFILRSGAMPKGALLATICIMIYMAFSLAANIIFLSVTPLNTDYPIKLLFNVVTLALLLGCHQAKLIDGNSLFKILDISTWLMIAMILIPKALGLGNTIYHGGIGYKAFFYSNNELSVALIILFYFSLFRLAKKLSPIRIFQLLAILVCVLLLNTKSGMAACLLGGGLFVAEYLLRKGAKFKIWIILGILLGLVVAKDFIAEQLQDFMSRQTYLHGLYGGSLIDTILSGRTFKLDTSWNELKEGPAFFFRLLFGNGFCSESLVEMDFIDIFFYLGIFGVVSLTGFLGYIFIASFKNFRKDGTLVRPFGFLTVIGFAFLAGHVFFMATAGCYFVLLCCFCLMYAPSDSLSQTTR